jgi:hypothetical protein
VGALLALAYPERIAKNRGGGSGAFLFAYAAFDLAIDGLRPGLGSDDLVVRTAIRALEWFCLEHDRPNIALARLVGSKRSARRRINENQSVYIKGFDA